MQFSCPRCGKQYRTDDSYAERKGSILGGLGDMLMGDSQWLENL